MSGAMRARGYASECTFIMLPRRLSRAALAVRSAAELLDLTCPDAEDRIEEMDFNTVEID